MRKLVLLALLPLFFTIKAMALYAQGLYENLSMGEDYWANNPDDPAYKGQDKYTAEEAKTIEKVQEPHNRGRRILVHEPYANVPMRYFYWVRHPELPSSFSYRKGYFDAPGIKDETLVYFWFSFPW